MARKKTGRAKRGFATMPQDKLREIASRGGKAAHDKGTAHEFTSEEAREAGRKSGQIVRRDRENRAEIGRKASVEAPPGDRSGKASRLSDQ